MQINLNEYNDWVEQNQPIKGHWHLGEGHEIIYRAKDATGRHALKAALVAAEPEALVIGADLPNEDGQKATHLVKLSGRWRVNRHNRIVFLVNRRDYQDTLLFRDDWKLGPHYDIIYTSGGNGGQDHKPQQLVFKGFWCMPAKNRLAFVLGDDPAAAMTFSGNFVRKTLPAGMGSIDYRIAVGSLWKKNRHDLSFAGRWKLAPNLGLNFEVDYDDPRKKPICFAAEYRLGVDRSITVLLKSTDGRPVGAELLLPREFLELQGQTLLRLVRVLEDVRIEAGVTR
ncbi:MAG: hypothetical protein WCG06_00785 [Candidatus Omnitrophota bacterium]